MFNFTFRSVVDLISFNNNKITELIYPTEIEIKETTNNEKSVSYLDLYIEFYKCAGFHAKRHDKKDDFNFPIVNFPFMSSYIPSGPAFSVYISLLRCLRACF